MIRFGAGFLVESIAACIRCIHCDESFDEAGGLLTSGGELPPQASHVDCPLRSIVGGINHQQGLCTCCGGQDEPDPAGLSRREAARLAAEYWRRHSAIPSP